MTYTISRSGKLNLLLIMLATLVVWLFAAWLLADTLQFKWTEFATTFKPQRWSAGQPDSWSDGQKTTAYFLLVVLFGAPFVVWDVLTEWFASYMIDEHGVQFTTLGLRQHHAWATLRELRTSNQPNEHEARIDVVTNETTPISLWRRFFHRRTVHRLPIYATVANRDALLATLTNRLHDIHA